MPQFICREIQVVALISRKKGLSNDLRHGIEGVYGRSIFDSDGQISNSRIRAWGVGRKVQMQQLVEESLCSIIVSA